MSSGIENSIFSQIESSTGESFDSSADVGSTADTPDLGTDVQQDQAVKQLNQRDAFDEAVDEQPKAKQPVAKAETKQPAKQQEAKKAPLKEQAPDKSHNQAHAERRLQSTVDRLRDVNKSQVAQIEGLTRQVAETRALNGIPQQFNLTNDEVIGGLELIHMMKSNPAQAAKKAMELALARGANLRDIVNDEFVPQIQLGAVQQLLDERLGPLTRNLQQRQGVEQEEAQRVEQARTKTAQFLADYPEAEEHSEAVAQSIRAILAHYNQRGVAIDPYVAAELAWGQVRNQLAQSQNQPPVQQQQQPVVQQRRPLPNGGNAPVQPRTNLASTDDSTRSIVRQAMAEAGYTF